MSHRVAGHPASWRSAADRPEWKEQLKPRLPGFPVARVSPAFREFPPGRTSALAVNEFVLWAGELAQGFPASNFKIFPAIGEIHKKARVIPRERWLSTALSTDWSTATSLRGGRPGAGPGQHPRPVQGAERRVRSRPCSGGIWAGMPHTQQGPSTYEVEGPRSGHPAGPPITRLPGCCLTAPPGRENQPEAPVTRFSPSARPDGPVARPAGVRGH